MIEEQKRKAPARRLVPPKDLGLLGAGAGCGLFGQGIIHNLKIL
ncbi:hypothetical protein [Virgibacillus saliphilus]|nr:hypothetical protein [Virgibacillus sp. NKC19-3]